MLKYACVCSTWDIAINWKGRETVSQAEDVIRNAGGGLEHQFR